MLKINSIKLDFGPRNRLVPHLKDDDKIASDVFGSHGVAMTIFESAFLCGTLNKFKPTKILEIGVGAGGTTAIIFQCLQDIGMPYELHSIDLTLKAWYGAGNKDTGYVAKYVKENNIITSLNKDGSALCGVHFEHYGTILPFVIEEIGYDIDFVILDTMHTLPGEILDFLAVLPYLKSNAIVVLHDIFWNQVNYDFVSAHATGTLFSAVKGDKFLNLILDEADLIYRYPNIGAFQITEQTMENIADVFLTLALRWDYFPPREQLRAYYKIFSKHYSSDICAIFENFIKANYLNLRIRDEIGKHAKNI